MIIKYELEYLYPSSGLFRYLFIFISFVGVNTIIANIVSVDIFFQIDMFSTNEILCIQMLLLSSFDFLLWF
jgi:hypothetical protein